VVSVTTRIVYGNQDKIEALLDSLGQKINTSSYRIVHRCAGAQGPDLVH
jgi:hypothetical protein